GRATSPAGGAGVRRAARSRRRNRCPAATLDVASGIDCTDPRGARDDRDRILLRAHLFRGGASSRPAAGDRENACPLRTREASQSTRERKRRAMTTTVRTPCEQTERITEYALRALPASEVSELQAHIAECPGCQQELVA